MQTLVLAGGQGTRLRPLTLDVPKPVVPLAGRPTNRVNAGCYVLEREVIDSIPGGRAVSFEREIFPSMVGDGLHGFPVEGYWKDIGTPTRYMEATRDLLSGRIASRLPERDFSGSLVPGCCAADGAKIGPRSVLGTSCRVAAGARIEGSVLHAEVRVGRRSVVRDSVLAAGVQVGDDAYVGPGALVGSRAIVRAGGVVEAGARIAPGAVVEPAVRTAQRAVA